MNFFDRFYWFKYNIIRFPFVILFLPIDFFISFIRICKTLFITDGSETLRFPWRE